MGGSSAEREIRDAVTGFLKARRPEARVIHELVVGGCRADIAAVEPQRVTLFEIKSARDTLSRLADQVRQFTLAAHEVIVVADERWFDRTPYDNGHPRFVPGADLRKGAGLAGVWAYPEVAGRALYGSWSFQRHWSAQPEPRASSLLGLLWRTDMKEECDRHRIAASSRTTCATMVRDMSWHMTGREIAEAVCRQLRKRQFPEADQPILAEAA